MWLWILIQKRLSCVLPNLPGQNEMWFKSCRAWCDPNWGHFFPNLLPPGIVWCPEMLSRWEGLEQEGGFFCCKWFFFFAVRGCFILGDLFWAARGEEQWHPVELGKNYSLNGIWGWSRTGVSVRVGIRPQKGLGWKVFKNLIPWAGTPPRLL